MRHVTLPTDTFDRWNRRLTPQCCGSSAFQYKMSITARGKTGQLERMKVNPRDHGRRLGIEGANIWLSVTLRCTMYRCVFQFCNLINALPLRLNGTACAQSAHSRALASHLRISRAGVRSASSAGIATIEIRTSLNW